MNDLRSTLQVGPQIAHGHFGAVYSGSDGVRANVAVKRLRQHPTESDASWNARKADLLREGNLLERAKHKNIVGVHYACYDPADDTILLVMEFCDGGSLDGAYRDGALSLAEVLKIAQQVCFGLAALHDRQMIHRDLKPGNILRAQDGTIKIGDFGFVTDEIVEGYAAGAGYLDHLAPEFYSDGVTSTRSDLWALGMTLYRLLHGHPWYESMGKPRHSVADGSYADRLKWLPHVGAKWRRLIRKLLNDVPKDRPDSARAVLRSLAAIEQLDWSYRTSSGVAVWEARRQNRLYNVELRRSLDGSYQWSAVSKPVATGNIRRLKAGKAKSLSDAHKQIRSFLDSI